MFFFFRFTKHSFTPPFKISEPEFDTVKSTPRYVKAMTHAEWQIFNQQYKTPLILWSALLVSVWTCMTYIKPLPDWAMIAGVLVFIPALAQSLGYAMSTYSLWEVIQRKQKFYGTLKSIADASGDYNDFIHRFENRKR